MAPSPFALVFFAAGVSFAAIHGTVKDKAGHSLAGVLVVAEGTDLSGVSDGNGHFELSNVAVRHILQFRNRLEKAQIRMDAMGRFQRKDGAHARTLWTYAMPTTQQSSTGPGADANLNNTVAARIAADETVNLLVSGDGYFSSIVPVSATSSDANDLTLDSEADLGGISVQTLSGDITLLEFNDSLMRGVDIASHENPICMNGAVKFLPDTSSNRYKIAGKTLYLWSDSDITDGDLISTILSNGSGQKLSTWYFNGIAQAPIALPDSLGMTQSELDSLINIQRGAVRMAGTAQISQEKIHYETKSAVCFGQALAGQFSFDSISATAKSCNEVELKNGTETATWKFDIADTVMKWTFTYQDSSCNYSSPYNADPAYSCADVADGDYPDIQSNDPTNPDVSGLINCRAYFSFITGGMTLPDFPMDSLPLTPQGLAKTAPRPSYWRGLPDPIKVRQQIQKRIAKRFY